MDNKYFVARGDTAKYKVTIHHADFSQERDDYYIVLEYGIMGGEMVVDKGMMPVDEEGNIFLLFETSEMVGLVKAVCHYFVPDTDIQGGVREEVDIQYLCFVSSSPATNLRCDMPEPIHEDGVEHVTYERVFRGDVNTLYLNLRTGEGENIVDSEGRQSRVHKGEQELY